MSDQFLAAIAAVIVSVAGILAGAGATPASAVLARTCCFNECAPFPGSARSKSDVLSKHGSWSATVVGAQKVVAHDFHDGATFAIFAHQNGDVSLRLADPTWRFRQGQRVDISIDIDGRVFKGVAVANRCGVLDVAASKALVVAFYRGNQALIEVGEHRLAMDTLADAAAVIDDLSADVPASR
jgi:hypothetical protein